MPKLRQKTQDWKEIDMLEVRSMATNPFNPGREYGQRILNVHPHERPGGLVLRPGYTIKYQKPTHPTITDSTYPNFGIFFDREADADGQEVTCLIQKGTLNALDDGGTPIVSDTMNGFWFWCRPDWKINVWDDGWDWVNKTFITKITTATDSTYKSMIKIFGNELDHGIYDGDLVGWTIFNKTKNQTARIITNIDEGSDVIRINHTLYNSDWEVDDVVIISRAWLDADYQTTLYNTVQVEDIVFHNVNNDLRIGFGGQESRPGLAIGYRQNYLQLVEFDFPNLHPDIDTDALQEFCETNDLILDTSYLEKDSYGIEIDNSGDGSLDAGFYYFRLTGRQDLYTEQLLAEDFVQVEDNGSVSVRPFMYLGIDNPRITSFKLYYSTDNITFYKITEYTVKDTAYNSITWKVDQFSRYIALETNSLVELHTESNAASIDNEANTVGSWVEILGFGDVTTKSVGANSSSYSLYFEEYTAGTFSSTDRIGMRYPVTGIKKGNLYDITFYAKAQIPYKKLYVWFAGSSLSTVGRTQEVVEVIKSDFAQYTVSLLADDVIEDIAYLCITVAPEHGTDWYVADGDGVKLSQDEGATWNLIAGGTPENKDYVILGDRLITFTAFQLYASFNNGDNWNLLGTVTPFMTAIKVIDENIYVGCSGGEVYKSTDKGATLTQLTSDVSGGSSYQITDLAQDDTYLYASTIGGGVYRSDDDGATWTQVVSGLTDVNCYKLYADLANDKVLVASVNTGAVGVFVTSNNGSAWTDVTNTVTGAFPSNFVDDGTYIFLCTYDQTATATCGVWRTSDHGSNWTDIAAANSLTEDKGYNFPYQLDDTLYFGSDDGTDGSKLYKTNTAGITSIDEVTAYASTVSDDEYPNFFADENTFWIDEVSIKEFNVSIFNDTADATTEMSLELGYTPTFDIVKGWDQALALRGRIYYLNPFVDKRYENFLIVSHIHSDGAYMWDIGSFSNFRELERFDSGVAVGMAILPTTEIIILKDKAVEVLSDDGLVGILREPIVGVSCVARNSIVDLGGIIIWGGVEDVYTYTPTKGVTPILEMTIRDIYLALENKGSMFGIRDRYNTYRLRAADETNKTEFLFNKIFDVIEEKKYLYPEIYREDSGQVLNFLNQGNIYGILHGIDNIGYGKLYAGDYGQRL
jgi:hypothetical protein